MSWPALKWMLLKRLPAPQKATGITLARRQPDDLRPFADPAATLADESGLSLSGFKLAVSGLEAKGLLVIVRQRNRPNLYDLQLSSASHDVTTHEVTSDDVTTHEVMGRQSRGDQPASHEVTTYKHRDKHLKTNTSSRKSQKAADPRFQEFVEDLKAYWEKANPGLGFEFGSKDGAAMKGLLKAKPSLNRATFQICLSHRWHSDDVTHCDDFFTWLPRVLKYANGPLDKYSKPKGARNDNGTGAAANRVGTTKADATSANAAAVFAEFTGRTGAAG